MEWEFSKPRLVLIINQKKKTNKMCNGATVKKSQEKSQSLLFVENTNALVI